MAEVYTIRQVLDAANASRRQLDNWVSKGLLTLLDVPPVGEARRFTLLDAINIAAMAEFARLGMAPNRMPNGVWHIPGFFEGGDPGVLLIWQGPQLGLPYDPFNPMLQVEIVHSGLEAMLRDPDKRAVIVIDLAGLESRVRQKLTASGGPYDAELRHAPVPPLDESAIYARLNKRQDSGAQ